MISECDSMIESLAGQFLVGWFCGKGHRSSNRGIFFKA
jgi:hypothetical protein